MSKVWRKTTIGELISSGVILIHKDGNHGANYPRVDDFGTDGLPFLTAKSISDWTIDFQGAPRLSLGKAKTFKFGFVKGGDVLLSHNATVGRVAIVPENKETAVIGTSLTQFRVDPSKLLPEFLALYFSSRDFQEQLSFVMAQTTRNQVPITEQRKLPIQLPDFGTQRAIVGVAFGLIGKIELNRKMNATLETMARALFRDWFVDFGPTRAKMEGRAPYLSPDLWSLFPDRLDHEGKPEGWAMQPLVENFDLLMGQSPPGDTYNDSGEGLPFFQGRTDFGFRFPENRKYCSAPTRVAENADTLVSVRAPVGDINLAAERCCIGRGVAALRHKSGGASFTYYTAWSLQDELRQFENTGTVFGAINKKQFEKLPTVDPGLVVIEAFESIASALDKRIESNELESRTLAQTRDLLLPRLMSGELRVADVDNLAREVA